MTGKTAAERKASERERMRSLGLVLRQVWVHPKDWDKARKYIDRLLRRHLK